MEHPRVTRSTLPVIAIVGRANVGKSTLWNRVVEGRRAIISDRPHTTRDRNIETAVWRGMEFQFIDTGGVDVEDNDVGRGIREQVDIAMREADVILFLFDTKVGVIAEDVQLAKELRRLKKPTILVANKADNARDIAELGGTGVYGLGMGDPLPISGATGKGVGDLLDAIYHALKKTGKPLEEARKKVRGPTRETRRESGPDGPIHVVIMGRTNVGKSSLVNAILGEQRVIVADQPHTTREPQDTELMYDGRKIVLVDTAGMRKRARIKDDIEHEAIDRNKNALDRADIAVLVLDATIDPLGADKELGGLMKEERKGLIIAVNKWDLVEEKTTRSATEAEARLRAIFPFLSWAPIIFVSAKVHRRTTDVLDAAIRIQQERYRVIDYNAINRLLKSVIKQKKPLQVLGPKSPHIHDIAQTNTAPPTFLVTVRGEKETLHPSWLKFLERRIREKYGFEGTPIDVRASNVPMAKSERAWNLRGEGIEQTYDAPKKKKVAPAAPKSRIRGIIRKPKKRSKF